MLKLSKVYKAIEAKKPLLENLGSQNIEQIKKLRELSQNLSSKESIESFNNYLLQSSEQFYGALATEELTQRGLAFSVLDKELNSQEEVSLWKQHVLEDRIVFATDGSQIEADKNLNMFFGAIQVAWFVNFHSADKAPIKDLDFELIVPSEMTEEEDELRQKIAFERFAKEIQALMKLMDKISEATSESGHKKKPVGFFDGSLTVSFVHNQSLRKKYLSVVSQLLEKSEKLEIPVVGYIDTSLASNLTKSLEVYDECLNPLNKELHKRQKIKVNDANLLKNMLPNWGDRSAYFSYLDKKDDNLNFQNFGETSYEDKNSETPSPGIGFCYLRSSSSKQKPSRLEIPLWVYEKGLIDDVIEVVLAECLVGNGYPYPIEVADSIAVLRQDEKETFYNLIQKAFEKDSVGLDFSNKLKRKLSRRRSVVSV